MKKPAILVWFQLMSPEEKQLLERTLKLSEENNRILKKLNSRARWAFFWGFLKACIIVIPLVIGLFYLQPYLDQANTNFNSIKELLNLK